MDAGDLAGKTLAGRYRVIRPIGAGGMGIVYEALQVDLGRRVAIKVLREVDAASRARFEQEARATAALRSPHIVSVIDFQAKEPEPIFFVMELLEGESLATRLRRASRIPPDTAVRIATQMLDALAEAHRVGMVHRDVKPSNVFLVRDSDDFVKLVDFGIAKIVSGEGLLRTTAGVLLGSPRYMAPEQVRNVGVDARTDVHGVAVCLHEMLSGQRPFRGENEELLRAVIVEPLPSLVDFDVSRELADVVAKGLAKEPADRWQTAQEMKDALASAPLSRRSGLGHLFFAACGATLVVAGGAALVVFASQPRKGSTVEAPDAPVAPVTVTEPPDVDAESKGEPDATVDAARSVAAHPGAQRARCWCREVVGLTARMNLCAKRRSPPSCECSAYGVPICAVHWKWDANRVRSCERHPPTGPDSKNGDACSGWAVVLERDGGVNVNRRTDGVLRCDYCAGNVPPTPGIPGAACTGYDVTGDLRHGKLFCD